jgi:cytochrome P450
MTSAIEIFDPMNPRTLKEPFEAYRALRERYPVAFLEPLGIWTVSRHADARSVLAAPDDFSAALAFGKNASITDSRSLRQLNVRFAGDSAVAVSSADGDEHARLRRLVARLMSKPRLDAAEVVVAQHVRQVISTLAAERDEVDVVGDVAKPIAAKAIGTIMGLSDDLVPVLASWVDLTSYALDPGHELSMPSAAPRMTRGNLDCVRAVTAFLRRQGTDGLHADPSRPREEVILSILQLFQAGYETIVSAVSHFLAALTNGRASWPAGPASAGTIEEGLRLASPVRATFRTTVGPQVIGGVPLPDGAMVMVLIGSANRDERVFDEPDEMRPERPAAHIAFGAGPHRCLGRFLAHLELRHVLTTLMSSAHSITALEGARVNANILKASYDYLPVHIKWR